MMKLGAKQVFFIGSILTVASIFQVVKIKEMQMVQKNPFDIFADDTDTDDVIIASSSLQHKHKEVSRSNDDTRISSTEKFITFEHIDNQLPFNNSDGHYLNPNSECGIPLRRRLFRSFPEPFRAPGIFDFRTQVRTNLNILYIGSSVANQFFKSFEQALTTTEREVIRYSYGYYHETTSAARTIDGGVLGSLRVTGVLTRERRNCPKDMAPQGGGGWLDYDVRELKRLVHTWRKVQNISTAFGKPTSPCEINSEVRSNPVNNESVQGKNSTALLYPCEQKNFDIIVHQIPAEWHNTRPQNETVTTEAIHEIVDTSFNEIGANTLIIQTIPINNNIHNISEVTIANERIWRYARNFESSMNSTAETTHSANPKRQILVMDLFAYSAYMFLQNSMTIGFIPDERGTALKMKMDMAADYNEFLTATMELNEVFNYTSAKMKDGVLIPRKLGQICGSPGCRTHSIITSDGIHFCMTETGARIDAALACLSQCSLQKIEGDHEGSETRLGCERRCNKQYMSLAPVLSEKM